MLHIGVTDSNDDAVELVNEREIRILPELAAKVYSAENEYIIRKLPDLRLL